MKLSTLRKTGGISIIAGAFLFTVWAVCWTFLLPVQERLKDFSVMVLHPNWIWVSSLAFPGVILTLFGFTAIYSLIYEKSGVIGLLGYLLITLAYVLQAAQLSWEIFLYPAIAAHGPSIALFRENLLAHHQMFKLFLLIFDAAILLGVILFGITLIRSKEFPKIGGILFLAGAVIYAVGPMFWIYLGILGVLVLSTGCFVLGYRLTKNA